MYKGAWMCIAMAVALLGGPAAAQPAPGAPDQAPIVVQGQREADRNREVDELVNALTPAPSYGHIVRFEHAVCPAVVGMSPAQAATALARMRAVAAAADVPVGSANCRANVLVMITSDKRELIEQLARRFPAYLGELSNRDIAKLAQSPEPTALWNMKALINADGVPMFGGAGDVAVNRTGRGGSRIVDQMHDEYVGSVLVMESRALAGLTVTQLADYAAMRAFTGADPARLPDRNVSTILTVLDAPMGSAVPITLTRWDLAFLKSFYASDANLHAGSQRSAIRAGMRRQVERAADR